MNKLICLFLSCFLVLPLQASSAKKDEPIQVRWVLAHEPIGLFKAAADMFAKEVQLKTEGKVKVEVLTLNEYEATYRAGKKVQHREFMSLIQRGAIQMSQTYTTDLGELSKPMYALDLPFLFRDHDHAKNVLEGEIGNNLLSGLTPAHIKGLAFTYSGGYRIIPGTKKIETLNDFKGLKIRTSNSPIAQETFNILGAKAIPMPLDAIEKGIKDGKIDDAESTYARYFTMGQDTVSKIVNETNHSLFLTSIIVNNNFWTTLPKKYQDIMAQAAINAARMEREQSIASAEETKKRCAENGIQIVSLNSEEQEKFKAAVSPIYKKYAPLVGEKLITSIQQSK